MNQAEYPKRLIEVDQSIKKIRETSCLEKAISYSHIFRLFIWREQRSQASCQAMVHFAPDRSLMLKVGECTNER